MICGSVSIDDNNNGSNNKDTNIKHFNSIINDEVNNLLKQSKLYVYIIGLDTKTL